MKASSRKRRTTSPRQKPAEAQLSIGALARATGVPVETLRTWELRYGYPVPERKPSGHRVYDVAAVARLRRIAQAIALGHRAGDVVPASERELDRLLQASGEPTRERPRGVFAPPVADPLELLPIIERLDADRLTRVLLAEWARRTPVDWAENCVAPLLRVIGEAWSAGRLDVSHEHFAAERIGDVLRTVRMPFEERARGALVACATLPGEHHGLGLQMAALVLSSVGCRVLYLGVDVPLGQIAAPAIDARARAVALSVSAAGAPNAANLVPDLRALLPRRVALLVGGVGAPDPPPAGCERVPDLVALAAMGQRLGVASP